MLLGGCWFLNHYILCLDDKKKNKSSNCHRERRAAGGRRRAELQEEPGLGPQELEGVGVAFVFLMKKQNKQQQKETMTICMPLGMLSTSVPTSSFVTRSRCRGRRSRMLPQQNARLLLSRPHGGDFNGRKQRFLRATTHFSPWAPEARLMLVARRKEPG